ncbi:MAG: hypothetical protein JSR87_07765 [Proteobacteria bacterium]|nr:hypothetical protein [Pseudomonadota bacterium]
MLEILKSIHLICLLLGGAASLGNAVLMKRVMASGAPPPALVADAMKVQANMGLGAVIVLWLTGLPMAAMTGAFANGGPLFSLKLLAATALLVIVPYMVWMRSQAASGRRPLDVALLARLSLAVRVLVVLVIVLAVLVFH